MQVTGFKWLESHTWPAFAGYGSAGGQPERRTLPKGPWPRGRGRHALAAAHWPNAPNSGGRGQSPRGLARAYRFVDDLRGEKKQLIHRLPPEFVRGILNGFNSGAMDVATARTILEVSRTRLYELRTAWLRDKGGYQPSASGGDHAAAWPTEIVTCLEGFLPLQSPPNYQLLADELERLHGFKRARSTLEAYAKKHLAHLIAQPERKARTYRRFRRARIGELWQHDSSIHQWWPAAEKQSLLLTSDDCSGFCVGGSFVERDTTWRHFVHFRGCFERYGLPDSVYTDALSLFGPSSSHDHSDPRSEFQRALRALHVAHLVAPTPQAKGKIERRFNTFQNRLVTMLAHEKVEKWDHAQELLEIEIERQNRKILRSTGKVPAEVWEQQILDRTARLRPTPDASLLDLHLSLRSSRKVHLGHIIQFDGLEYEIAPTSKQAVTVLFHPFSKLWVLENRPKLTWPPILGHFTL